MTVSHVYNLAETHRLFKCIDTLRSIPEQIESIFRNDISKMTKPSNLHYAYIMNERAKEYGLAQRMDNFLENRVKDHLLDAFNQTDFSMVGSSRSLSADSLKVLEIFSSLQSSTTVGSKTKAIITSFLQKISKQAFTHNDKYSYFSSKIDNQELSSSALNHYVLQILKHTNSLDSLSKEQRLGLRNFFA